MSHPRLNFPNKHAEEHSPDVVAVKAVEDAGWGPHAVSQVKLPIFQSAASCTAVKVSSLSSMKCLRIPVPLQIGRSAIASRHAAAADYVMNTSLSQHTN